MIFLPSGVQQGAAYQDPTQNLVQCLLWRRPHLSLLPSLCSYMGPLGYVINTISFLGRGGLNFEKWACSQRLRLTGSV